MATDKEWEQYTEGTSGNVEIKQIVVEADGKLCAVVLNECIKITLPTVLASLSDGPIKYGTTLIPIEGRS